MGPHLWPNVREHTGRPQIRQLVAFGVLKGLNFNPLDVEIIWSCGESNRGKQQQLEYVLWVTTRVNA